LPDPTIPAMPISMRKKYDAGGGGASGVAGHRSTTTG
jgi:hypothetical protein